MSNVDAIWCYGIDCPYDQRPLQSPLPHNEVL